MTSTRAAGGVASHALPPHQQARRDRIVQAALQLLNRGEYDQIQMRDVAAGADVALGTLYRYFSSKEHLYAAVMLEWMASFGRKLEREPLPAGARDAVREFMRRAIAAFVRKPQFLRLQIVLDGSTDRDAAALHAQFANRYFDAFHAMLPDLPPARVQLIERAIGCVLATMLREHAMGRVEVNEVYDTVLGTVDLIFPT
jgi:AcrR family transcriptional regulator